MSMTRNEARDLWCAARIRNEDLTPAALAVLREHVNQAMIDSRSGEPSLRASPAFKEEKLTDGSASIHRLDCTASWFGADQQAISIHPDGFVGFAGWASDCIAQPILEGFVIWVSEMEAAAEMEVSNSEITEP